MFRRLAPQHDHKKHGHSEGRKSYPVILSESEESLRCFAPAQHDKVSSSLIGRNTSR